MTRITIASIRDSLSRRDPRTASSAGRREAAVALVLAPDPGGMNLLLIKRAERAGDPWSGQMALPGGRREAADPDLAATAMRETREETGIALRRDALLGQLDDLAPTIAHLPRMLVRPFVFALPAEPSLVLSAELTLALWTPLMGLPGLVVEEEIEVRSQRRRVSGFRIGEHLVWGMTERILLPFLEIAGIS